MMCDQAVFLKKFHKDVSTHRDYPDNFTEMQTTLEAWLEEGGRSFLKKCLSPTETSSCCSTARSQHQDCLLRLLLQTPGTQAPLLKHLLEQLALVSLDEEEHPQEEHSQVPRLILNAARFLNTMEQPEELAETMYGILVACSRYRLAFLLLPYCHSRYIQVEVISALPELLPDCEHPAMALRLRSLLEEQARPHTASILDCMANLSLEAEVTAQVSPPLLT